MPTYTSGPDRNGWKESNAARLDDHRQIGADQIATIVHLGCIPPGTVAVELLLPFHHVDQCARIRYRCAPSPRSSITQCSLFRLVKSGSGHGRWYGSGAAS